MANYEHIKLNQSYEELYENLDKLSPILLHRYLKKFEEEEREKLKSNLRTICYELAEKNIFVPMDFEPIDESIYSETLDRELLFFESAGIIKEIKGSVIYKITEKGFKLSNEDSGLYKGISPAILGTMDDIINTMYNDNQ